MLDNDAINNWDTNGQYSWSDFWNSYSPGGAFQSALDYVLTGNNYAPGSAAAFSSHLSNDYWSGAMTNRGIQAINAVGNMAAGGTMMFMGGTIIAGTGGTGAVLGGGYLGVRGGSLLESGLTDYASLLGGNSGNGDYISQWLNNAFGPWGPTIDAAMMALAGCLPCSSGANAAGRAAAAAEATAERNVVIGENMPRVEAYATQIEAETYRGMPGFKPVLEAEGLIHNEQWLQARIGGGYRIIDIGPDFARRSNGIKSSAYEMERRNLNGYQNYIKSLSVNNAYFSICYY